MPCGLPEDRRTADADHSGQSHRLWLSAQGRTRLPPMASPWAKTRFGWSSVPMAGPRTPSSWCLTQSWSTLPTASASAARGRDANGKALFAGYRQQFPELAAEIDQMQRRELPAGWDRDLPSLSRRTRRESPAATLRAKCSTCSPRIFPWFLGGSADLGSSNKTTLKFPGAGDFEAETPGGRNFHFGIREHAMAAIVNGLSLSKLRAFGGTFLIFSDYARPAIRLSALMELPTIFVFTHDAMGDGEDGPTHQPVEQLAYRCAPFPAWSCSGRRTPMRSSRLTATSCSCATSRRRSHSRGSRCRPSTVANMLPRPVWRGARTSWRALRTLCRKSS